MRCLLQLPYIVLPVSIGLKRLMYEVYAILLDRHRHMRSMVERSCLDIRKGNYCLLGGGELSDLPH